MSPARGIDVLRVLLGALFATALFDNLTHDRYTADGYSRLVDGYAKDTAAPGFWKDGVMGFFSDNSEVFAPLQLLAELGFVVLLVLGVATAVAALAASGFLFSLWLSQLASTWLWELLSLTAIALVVGLTTLPALRRPGPLRERLLGESTFGGLPMGARLAIAIGAGLLLVGAVLAADTGGSTNTEVAWESGALFGGLLVVCAFLDGFREDRDSGSEEPREP
jgi:uncharacterized membrane protein YphA (DoxX/SURF4 family)